MIVRVLLFAEAKERVGESSLEIEVDNGATIGSLKKILSEQFPQLAPLIEHSAFSLNKEYAPDDALLGDGCEVAMIPPVSGG